MIDNFIRQLLKKFRQRDRELEEQLFYEDALFPIYPKQKYFRNLKEIYVQFNSRNVEKPIEARNELDELI